MKKKIVPFIPKIPVKGRQNRGLTALPKPLVALGELQCDLCQHQE